LEGELKRGNTVFIFFLLVPWSCIKRWSSRRT